MGKYLDPKADVTFKKIFGQHPHLLKSFLNAVLPLPENGLIDTLEYLPVEQIPDIPTFKRTIVDVKCKDNQGKIFIVEMQIEWTTSFMQRLLFGAAQAYVKQLKPGETYHLLNPVYGLALINSVFDMDTSDWYHHYGLVKLNNEKQEIINGLTLVFVELPKFKASSHQDKKLKVLWLRFMREITEQTREVDPVLLSVPEIKEALHLAEQSAYSPAELDAYEGYWKAVSSEKTLMEESRYKGKQEEKIEIAKKMKKEGLDLSLITLCTGLSREEIERLWNDSLRVVIQDDRSLQSQAIHSSHWINLLKNYVGCPAFIPLLSNDKKDKRLVLGDWHLGGSLIVSTPDKHALATYSLEKGVVIQDSYELSNW